MEHTPTRESSPIQTILVEIASTAMTIVQKLDRMLVLKEESEINKRRQVENMAGYMRQLSRPDQANPIPYPVLGEQKRSQPSQYDSLNDRSEHAQSLSSLSSEDDESQSSEETTKQADQPCTVRSPGDSALYPKQTVDEAPPHPVEPTEGATKSRVSQQPGRKRSPLEDITKETKEKETKENEAKENEAKENKKRKMTGQKGLSTEHSYFSPLSQLRYHLNLTCPIDTIAVVVPAPDSHQNPNIGENSLNPTFYILDRFVECKTPVVIRPSSRGSLPVVHEGDGILLRNFVVRSANHELFLRSCDVSAWCVFNDRDGGFSSGPPVEYGDAERTEIERMRSWWRSN